MTNADPNNWPLSFSLYNRLRAQRNIGIQEGLQMAITAVKNLKEIKAWESDGEKFTDIWFDADGKTKDAAVSAIEALVKKQ
jgi:hypothetical protein